MKVYNDYEKRLQMTDAITYHNKMTYEFLKQLIKDNRLDNYDLFLIYTNDKMRNPDNPDYMFYKDGELYYIENEWTTFKMVESQLKGRTFEFINGGNSLYENGVQRYINKYGIDKFNELNDRDLISVIKGNYFKEEINNLLDGLIDTLKDLNETLEDTNKKLEHNI